MSIVKIRTCIQQTELPFAYADFAMRGCSSIKALYIRNRRVLPSKIGVTAIANPLY